MASKKPRPRYLDYGFKPKPMLAKSLKKLDAARDKLREIGALWADADATVENRLDMETLPALDELEKTLRAPRAGGGRMKVYVVMGQAGEYDDHTEWVVVAYLSEDAARQHVKDADAAAKAIYDKFGAGDRKLLPPKRRNRFDPKHKVCADKWDDTHYFFYTVEVADAPNLTFPRGKVVGSSK
jgi:hypothetical protein